MKNIFTAALIALCLGGLVACKQSKTEETTVNPPADNSTTVVNPPAENTTVVNPPAENKTTVVTPANDQKAPAEKSDNAQ